MSIQAGTGEPKLCDGSCARYEPPRKQKCPVCEGHGIVPAGFYTIPAGQTGGLTSTNPESCRLCDGLGWTW